MLKIKKKVKKDWSELKLEEKVNLIRKEQEGPGLGGVAFLYAAIGFIFITTFYIFIIILSSKFNILENNYGFNLTLNQTTTNDVIEIQNLGQYIELIFVGFFIFFCFIFFYQSIKHSKKWRPFMKSLKKEQEVRY